MTNKPTGVERIARAFADARAQHAAALMPYFTLGYPDRDASVEAIAAVAAHSDLLELGVPFSDPIADGPTIQRSTQRALEAGATVEGCLAMVRALRARGVATPAMLMGYYNPILAYGIARYVAAAAAAGIDGLIVPDLPPEEADELAQAAAAHGLAYIYFLAPTSNPQRMRAVTARAQGFIYMVSVTGVTGARAAMRDGLDDFVRSVRAQTDVPIAVGFGISTPAQAGEVGRYADGVIVGSALINTFDRAGVQGAADFARALRAGLHADAAGEVDDAGVS